MKCLECESEYPRITPLLKAQECLSQHPQYICGSCGRCICMGQTKTGLARWNFPFSTLDQAILYLRSGDAMMKTTCGIYELQNEKGRVFYKIFASEETKQEYLRKHPNKQLGKATPVYQKAMYQAFPNTQIRMLSDIEITTYLKEQALSK